MDPPPRTDPRGAMAAPPRLGVHRLLRGEWYQPEVAGTSPTCRRASGGYDPRPLPGGRRRAVPARLDQHGRDQQRDADRSRDQADRPDVLVGFDQAEEDSERDAD